MFGTVLATYILWDEAGKQYFDHAANEGQGQEIQVYWLLARVLVPLTPLLLLCVGLATVTETQNIMA